jgi:hypothetical protein
MSEVEKYISGSKLNIDNYIAKREFRKAFGLLILFLERLDGEEKAQVVDYYSKNLEKFGFFINTFPSS